MDDAKLILKKKQRYQFLKSLYDRTDGNENSFLDPYRLGNEFGWDELTTENVVQYLQGEGLIEQYASDMVKIKHLGRVEVEETIANPHKPTEHFPPNVTQYIINAQQITNSPIQQGTQDTIQTVSYPADTLEKTREFVEVLKGILLDLSLDNEDKAEIQAEIITIESQLSSSRPKANIIAVSIETINSILKSIPANVAANIIVNNSPALPLLINKASELLKDLSSFQL